jgi:SAM-dependent methyltransferase
VHEILRKLPPDARVLDLGCARGSFDASAYKLTVIRVDLEALRPVPSNFVMASAAALPFGDRSFNAVISNHSLEHFENLETCIQEIARVLAPVSFIFIAIPDASTFTDRLYRWLASGGGHVNQIQDVHAIPRLIGASSGLPLAATRVLCTSLSFINRRNIVGKPPGKLLLLANGRESVIRALVYVLRTLDRWLGWRTSVYGWAYYFGQLDGVDTTTASNVCIGCGSSHPSRFLESSDRVKRRRFRRSLYTCPACETRNYFTDDASFRSLS